LRRFWIPFHFPMTENPSSLLSSPIDNFQWRSISSNWIGLSWRIFIAMIHAHESPYNVLITQPQYACFLGTFCFCKNIAHSSSRHITPPTQSIKCCLFYLCSNTVQPDESNHIHIHDDKKSKCSKSKKLTRQSLINGSL
jgi:hypothetical protein